MKKIVKLTESDLVRIVKRVINENNTSLLNEGNGQNAVNAIKKGMAGLGTDERGVLNAVYMIKNKADYMEALAAVKKLGYNTIGSYISTDMEEVSYGMNVFGFADKQNKIISEINRHLQQFNPEERVKTLSAQGSTHGRTQQSSQKKPFQGLR
jgi:hypothetical protein